MPSRLSELPSDRVGAIDLKIDLLDAFDLADQHFITLGIRAMKFQIPPSGSLQLLADWLDPESSRCS